MGRTNIVIDEKLVTRALKLSGAKSKREVVDRALREFVDKYSLYGGLLKLQGKVKGEWNLKEWRKNRV